MSGEITASRDLASDALSDFGGFALEAIHQLQAELKTLRAQLEERDKTIDLLTADLERARR